MILNSSTFDVGDNWGLVWHEIMDVDGDGLADLLVYANSVRAWASSQVVLPEAKLRVYIQQSDGSLSDETSAYISGDTSSSLGLDLSVGDFNGDGRLDFVLGGAGTDPYFEDDPIIFDEQGEPDVFYLSQADGTWVASKAISVDVWTHNVAVGDITGNGLDDVFTTSIENGDNSKSGPDIDRSFLSLSIGNNILTYDQIKLPNLLTQTNVIYKDYTTHSYLDADGNTVYYSNTFTGAVVFDADGDGDKDLAVLADNITKGNLIFLNDGDGGFTDEQVIELPESIFGFGGAIEFGSFDLKRKGTIGLEGNSADIDRDGDLDLVLLSTFQNDRPTETVLGYAGTGLQVLFNDGNGSFSVSQNLIIADGVDRTYLNDFKFYDLNRDGWVDIIGQGTHYNGDYYRTEIYLNNGGVFSNATSTFIESKQKQYFPFHKDGELHFYAYSFDWTSSDPRDGEGNADVTIETIKANIESFSTIAGSDEAENLIGSAKDDLFLPAGGHDVIDGGAGTDTAIYAGDAKHFSITINKGGAVNVQDRSGAEGTDSLISIEKIDFQTGAKDVNLDVLDGVVNVSSADLSAFIEMYIAYFNRAPDAEGLFYWGTRLSEGMSKNQIAESFYVQPETKALYTNPDDTSGFVTAVYQNFLGRAPDTEGFNYWVKQLDDGVVSKPIFLLAIINGAKAATGSQTDVDYFTNKANIGAYYSVIKGLSNVDNGKAAMALYDGTAGSITAAKNAIDGYYNAALDANNGELLINLVGVMDDPFALV
ncbi:FG-GAP-like repeat-containing protein [Maritalea porphyrae]|uniref:FG-GAP-like repeat-containing protein n=1 Tax=Maritalea porphyrae TaxID=880732 RepID=UPI0022B00E83|nr:FG-GAP-like repeat-containing protein [Maritalea porphyrae]MCZ4274181.1 FG-GAP-like repeat-containing protein [Maritalea porphyrae]